MRRSKFAPIAALIAAGLLAAGCSVNLKDVKSTLDGGAAVVSVAYSGGTLAVLDTTIEGRMGMRPRLDVPESYRVVGVAVRDVLRTEAPTARVDMVVGDADSWRAVSDVFVRVNVDGAYFCDGGYLHQQTCTLSVRAQLLIEDHRNDSYTPLEYRVTRRSAPIPGSENWATIDADQARRAVPPDSLARLLADEVRVELDALLAQAEG